MLSGGGVAPRIAALSTKHADYLFLEATSSLDSETEENNDETFGEYGKDKTFLIIAHRLGTLNIQTNIAVMEKEYSGRGSYEKLMVIPIQYFIG